MFAIGTIAQTTDSLKYRIYLRDKAMTHFSLDHPEEFLSKKAIERRRRQQLPIDSTDLPVCADYIAQIQRFNVPIVAKGKWDNFVTISCSDSLVLDSIAKFSFVKGMEKVWIAPKYTIYPPQRDSIKNQTFLTDSIYGKAQKQISQINGVNLHHKGYKGSGMTIAVIDAGFHNMDRIAAMRNLKIVGTKDFVNSNSDIFAEESHGLGVLSCMAMNIPYLMVGTAPEASYWLLRSEDESSEHLVEQDYWAAAVEFADSVGVDVINSSLGYYNFDDKTKNYQLHHLDGKYSLISRQASKIADKGMVMVCSAGNSGAGSWKKITPPADAENIIAVGAVDKKGVLAPFSSIGNTVDNRIKPDVVAYGFQTTIMDKDGSLTTANGTSFASPIICGMVACLWQALPHLTAKQIIDLVRSVGNCSEYPNNIYGYGLPDIWKAYQNQQ